MQERRVENFVFTRTVSTKILMNGGLHPQIHRLSLALIPTTDRQVRHVLFAYIFIVVSSEATVSQQTKPECSGMEYQLNDYMNET
jgi:hypothetical protein